MKTFLYERKIKKSLKNCLYALAYLQQAFFVNYLRKDYIKHSLRYQKILNKKSKSFYQAIIKAHTLVANDSRYQNIFNKIDHLSEIFFSLNQLRFRVSDYSTFKICNIELKEIEKYSVELCFKLSTLLFKPVVLNISEFEEKIHAFEAIYSRVLQVISMDPFVFKFFIQDLYAMYDEMKALHKAIQLIKK